MTAIDPSEPCMALYRELMAERFPTYTEVRREARQAIPAAPEVYRPPAVKASGQLTRLEVLLLAERAAAWRTRRGVGPAA